MQAAAFSGAPARIIPHRLAWAANIHGHVSSRRAARNEWQRGCALALKLPILLRLTRRGNTITAEYSRDNGRTFQPAGQPMIFDPPLASTVYAGLAITSLDESLVSEAKFSGLEIRKRSLK